MPDQARDIVDAKLLHDLLAMLLNGLDAEIQLSRDLLIRITLSNELEHLSFPLSQFDIGSRRLSFVRFLPGLFAQTFSDSGAEVSVPIQHLADGLHDIFG